MRSLNVKSDFFVTLTFPLLCLTFIYSARAEEQLEKGRKIYLSQCVDCHGDKGQGVESVYPSPLIGDLAVRELSAYISEAMPEGEPEVCVAEDADAVAAYIHQEFYSIVARVRNQPPSVDFSRLTVRQYRNSVADLVNSFRWSNNFGDEQGLKARYYKSNKQNKENLAIERIDSLINFDFGEAGPDPENITEPEYTMIWEGSVLAAETGWYEFIVDSENQCYLRVNGSDPPLINIRVKSGDQTEYREEMFLLEGRAYGIRLEVRKSKTDKLVSAHLKWKPPHGTEQYIPPHYLSASPMPKWLIVETDFPPDDKSVGYERGVQVSQDWFDAVTTAAVEVTDKLMPEIPGMIKIPEINEEHKEKLKQFCLDFATRAFRRPLSEELKQLYIERQFAESPSTAIAVKRSLLLILKSPRFLFPYLGNEQFDDYDLAAWLSLTMWDSIPDPKLLEAAEKHQLIENDRFTWQVDRMVKDPRAKAKVRQFFRGWLYFDHFSELSKADDEHPEFNARLISELKDSLELFIEDIFWSDESDYRKLLQAESIYASPEIAEFYGLPAVNGPVFEKIPFEPEHRSGILTHPYLLAGLAYEDSTSPIHRGVFLSRSLLGRFLKPPPIAVTPTPPDLDPTMTTRERIAMQTKPVACSSCHGLINHLGFTLENFDEVGRYRKQERNRDIDASGYYISREGEQNRFQGAEELSRFLTNSDEAHQAFIEQFFQYLIKQPIQAFGPEMISELDQDFGNNQYNMQKLMLNIAKKSALRQRAIKQELVLDTHK
ncbi:DUF1592 domain-containing protein [Rubinisphaera italica]|uniref:PA14 domain protein n=1 Tax=Rubinisphaera italica TaxID=2527969 RepID=A0A5C5XK11_9PLAN|nr:DUF1592 domain-containing protein [Rubinisphaera italica]TWT63556.1 PA14 domain protein [Rubinisphaera italica]